MKKNIRLIIGALFLCAVIYILKFSPLSYYIFDGHGRNMFIERFQVYMLEMGALAPLIFIGFYSMCLLFFIPASVPTSIGGLVFGEWYGLLLNVIGAMIGGSMSFFLGRYLLRDFAAKLLTIGHFKALDDKVEEHGFSIMIYLRLLFVPFTYLSFAAGLSRIRFWQFFWGTFAGVIPGLAVVTFLISAIKKLFLTYKSPADLFQFDIIFPLVLFGLSFLIPPVLKHFKKKFNVTKEIEKEAGENV
jgi:uncharacterized membrane protein YdjX (TVP38/TMEM64 family)